MTRITRLYRFSASHRLHAPDLSEAENNRLYGKCNNPFGHGHDYVLELSVRGPVEPLTGRILPIATLDRLVEEQILRPFANRNLNLDVPEFETLVPTTENVALTIAALIEQRWAAYFNGAVARLARVHLQETDRNGFEVVLAPQPEMENIHA